jgi:nucleoside permease NupC
MQVLWGLAGVVVLMAIAFLLSKNRRAINLRTVIGALIIQIAFAVIVLYWDLGRRALRLLTDGVQAVINTSNAGIEFLFGPVLPDEGVAFAFQVLPIIIFFASLTSVLYYLKILQWVVELLGRGLQKALGTSGPESRTPAPEDKAVTEDQFLEYRNVIDAAASGGADGLRLALNVGAMLIAFISLLALLNLILGSIGGLFGFGDLSLQLILGYVFAPVAFVIGVPWNEALDAGSFIGQKTILNEFVAYSNFGPRVEEFSEKTVAIVTSALAGFANFGTIAILIGGVGGMAPSRRHQIAQFGIRAVIAGTLANLLNAAIAGMLVG